MPVEASVVMPLASLPDLAAHEEQLLARVRPHVRVERAKVGKLLPIVTGHAAEKRTFSVHDLVVRERQDEVLRPGVQEAEERDGAEVLAPAELVRHPLARLARVVKIERGRDGVDPETIDVIAVEPEEGAIEQEARDLMASVVEDERAPVGMLALPRVSVLVEVGAIEVDKTMRISREVCRDPVEDDADAATVEMVHEGHELPRAAIAARRGEVADRLITPRAVERMLHHGQELDVGKAHVLDVIRELVGQLAVVEKAVALLRHAAPGAEMHFVDRERLVERVAAG